MIGGMRIVPWRQGNPVTPVVTATQTGPGTHNGMAMTVKVLNYAAVTVNGPQYQSIYNPGTAGSANANPPAQVTITPQGSGSFIYGAVNRNDAATAWTPDAGAAFTQNIADSVNGAAYGTFRSTGVTTVAFDAAGPSSSGAGNLGASSISWSHTVTGTNTAILAGVAVGVNSTIGTDAGFTITSVTCGGIQMTQAALVHSNGSGYGGWYGYIAVYKLAGVATGANTITVTVSAAPTSLACGSLSFNGADQMNITGTPFTASSSGLSSPAAVAVTQNTAGNIIAAFTCCGSPIGAVADGVSTSQWICSESTLSGAGNSAGQTAPATGSTVTVSRTLPTPDWWAMIAVEVLSYGAGATTAGIPVTTGATNGDGSSGAAGGVAVAEILAIGPLMEDGSSPPEVSTTAAKSVSTASFTPPMGSLLVAQVATAGTNVGMAVTDSTGKLTWVELSRWASGTSGYAGVWAAVVVCG